MKLSERIRKIREIANLSRSDFEPNISSSTLRHWENGTYDPKDTSLIHLVDTFKKHNISISTIWLKTGKGTPPKINGRSVEFDDNTKITKNNVEYVNEENIAFEKDEILFRDVSHLKKIYKDSDTLLVLTPEMSPRFRVGDYVFGVNINMKNYRLIDLEPSIITLKNGKKYLCYFSYNRDTDKASFIYERGFINFSRSLIEKISIVVIHRRCMLLPYES